MSGRTLVILELDGHVSLHAIDAAVAAAGIASAGPTHTYDMEPMRSGLEHSYRPDRVCRMCGYPDPDETSGWDERNDDYCVDCWGTMSGAVGALPSDPATCPDCGAEHNHQFPCDVFTEEQMQGAVGYCPRCSWPEFDAGGGDGPPSDAATRTGMYDHD